MYKVDKSMVGSAVLGTFLCLSFSLSGCDSTKVNALEEKSNIYTPISDNIIHHHTVVFSDGKASILIPCDRYSQRGDFVDIFFDDDSSTSFSQSDITIFNDTKELDSYDQALNFALALSDNVYNYDDVINGEYNNIALGYKIESEIGITKKKDL